MAKQTKKYAGQIITSSARDWCESEGKRLEDYVLCGVEYFSQFSSSFRETIPDEAAVVADYRIAGTRLGTYEHGTALVQRRK